MYTLATLESPPVVLATLHRAPSDRVLRRMIRDIDERVLAPGHATRPGLLWEQRPGADGLAPHQVAEVDAFLARSVAAGVSVGRVVATALLARQLDRLAAEAGLSERLRHFDAREAALAWLRDRSDAASP